jgi:hypothetical protein
MPDDVTRQGGECFAAQNDIALACKLIDIILEVFEMISI